MSVTPRPRLSVAKPSAPRGLYDAVARTLRARNYSRRTEQVYVHWIGRYLRFHGGVDPTGLREAEVNAFLSDLAMSHNVAASTQNQALAALLFLYAHVLKAPLDRIEGVVRARKDKRLPVVLTRTEVSAVIRRMEGAPKLVALVLYGSGLRLLEALTLRVKDIGLGRCEITVRDTKGNADRTTMLPTSLVEQVRAQLQAARRLHREDLGQGFGRVALPTALARKYPNADREWAWQWLFPASSRYTERETGIARRHHLHETVVQKAVRAAARKADIPKHVTSHTFRHSFATHLLQNGYDIRTVQELFGHRDVRTTMIYTHVLNRGGKGVNSPLDSLEEPLR